MVTNPHAHQPQRLPETHVHTEAPSHIWVMCLHTHTLLTNPGPPGDKKSAHVYTQHFFQVIRLPRTEAMAG